MRLYDQAYRQYRKIIQQQREATSTLRLLPDALIIGAQKAGTTSLYNYLIQHPQVLAPSRKEPGYFDMRYGRGLRWYRSLFPTVLQKVGNPAALTLEASTGTIAYPYAAERVASLLPHAKLIALLRDPVERAYSHYHHTLRLGRETLSFEDALEREDARLADFRRRVEHDEFHYDRASNYYGYRARGRYAEQLERWLPLFDPERLLILKSEDLYQDEAGVVAQVLAFLGLEPHEGVEYRRHMVGVNKKTAMAADTERRLRAYFAPHNQRLYELIGRDMGWPES